MKTIRKIILATVLSAATAAGLAQPVITTQPTSLSLSMGATATFQVTVTGTVPFRYQWRFNGADLSGATNRSLVLTNVQLMAVGNYGVNVNDASGSITSQTARLEVDPAFTKVTTGLVATLAGNARGVAWADYDNDGFPDFHVARGAGWGTEASLLFHNQGDGTFTRLTTGVVVTSNDSGEGVWGDFDNDGFLDLAVGNAGENQNNALYRNKGDGTFERFGTSVFSRDGFYTPWLAQADYDGDGFLDLFTGGYGVTGQLYHGQGDGSFIKLTDGGPVTMITGCYATGWVDYDDDGDVDLFIAGNGNDLLFRNDGDGSFSQVTTGPLVNDADISNGFAWGDYDNDGDVDVFIATGGTGHRLYRNDGAGTFTDVTTAPFANDRAPGAACAWGDYDNDGFLDLFVANDSFPDGTSHFLYHNNGDGTFTRITTGSLVNDVSRSSGCAWADYDNDGFLDLFVANANTAKNFLYRNSGNDNQWLKVKCAGTASNRAAIGAKVRVTARIRGKSVTQVRQIGADGGRSHNDLVAHFGLGDASNIELVRIEWPSGVAREMKGVTLKQTLNAIEPDLTLLPRRQSVNPGSAINLTSRSNLSPSLRYQWQLDGKNLPGQTGSTLTLQNVQADSLGRYTVVVQDPNDLNSVFSATALLEPPKPPVLTAQPLGQIVSQGTNVTFHALAAGSVPLSYQWLFKGAPIAGATDPSLTLANLQPANAGDYSVEIRNLAGVVISLPAKLIVTGGSAPVITAQPVNRSVSLGARVTFSVTANSPSELTYQWRLDDNDLPGATTRAFAINSAALTNAGVYTVVVSTSQGTLTSAPSTLTVDPAFTAITTGAVVIGGGNSGAVAWGDYNNDGRIDLFVANWGLQNNALYRNNSNATFTAASTASADGGDSDGAAWADFDNDGDLDLFVANWAPPYRDFFYRNNGNGTLIRIDGARPFSEDNGLAWNAVWGDYDNDGNVDLFVSNDSLLGINRGNFLYHSRGDGTFEKVTAGPLVNDITFAGGASWGDYDNDGYLDLFVATFGSANLLFHNQRDGRFERVTTSPVNISRGTSYGVAWGDYDNDGDLDLFVPNTLNQDNDLFRNNGDGSFSRVTEGVVVNDGGDSWNATWGDYDNDGFLDLFVANYGGRQGENNALYHNNGDGSFTKIVTGSLVNDGGYSRSAAWGDYNNDGFLDLAVANGAWPNGADQREFLYRNNGNANHWLNVRCLGTASNRSAIGAKVRVKAAIRGQTVWQLREISGGNGFGQNDLRANFGLGDATLAETVRIEWPSGTVQELHNVAANQFLTVTEPPRLLSTVSAANDQIELTVTGGKGFVYQVEASSDLKAWMPLTTLTNVTGNLQFADPDAANSRHRFYRLTVP